MTSAHIVFYNCQQFFLIHTQFSFNLLQLQWPLNQHSITGLSLTQTLHASQADMNRDI